VAQYRLPFRPHRAGDSGQRVRLGSKRGYDPLPANSDLPPTADIIRPARLVAISGLRCAAIRGPLYPTADITTGGRNRRGTRPDGQISGAVWRWPVQPLLQKYSCSRFDQITFISALSSPSERGVGHRHERWDGMRWTRGALKTKALSCGRRSRVVLTPRRRRQVLEKQASQG
jgi:hypothetical protein